MVVENAGDRLAWFYEGLPKTETVPWDIWIRPSFWWLSFLGAIGVGCVSFGSIIRRQWVEQERLTFPFATVAEDLAQRFRLGSRTGRSGWDAMFRSSTGESTF